MKVILIFMILSVPDEGYSNLYDFERTWWRLLQSLWFWQYLMKVILIFMILSVPDEGYSNLYDFERTWWRLF
jgi:hypothetical protein